MWAIIMIIYDKMIANIDNDQDDYFMKLVAAVILKSSLMDAYYLILLSIHDRVSYPGIV
jgi:hypothetical protein